MSPCENVGKNPLGRWLLARVFAPTLTLAPALLSSFLYHASPDPNSLSLPPGEVPLL